jgi:hypothetical protein
LGVAAVKRKGAAVVAVAVAAVVALAAAAVAVPPKLRFIFRVEVTVGTKAARGVAPAWKYRRNLLFVYMDLPWLNRLFTYIFYCFIVTYCIVSEFRIKLITKHIIFHKRQVATNTKEELLNQNFFFIRLVLP